jgi:hypothetical protein
MAELPEKRMTPKVVSIREMADNPTGSGSAFLASRSMIRQSLNITFIQNLQRNRRQFFAMPYVYDNGDVLFHVKVPSEERKYNSITYDVLFFIKFERDKRYSMRPCRFFCNSPSFLFTYSYVFYNCDLMIDSCAYKIGQALTTPPVIRNPVESLGYEKILYQACRYLLDSFCLTDSYIAKFGQRANPATENDLAIKIADPQKIVELYQIGQRLAARTHRREISAAEHKEMEEKRRDYADTEHRNTPHTAGFIIKHAPRPKLTARQAIKKIYAKPARKAVQSIISEKNKKE